MKLRSSPLKVHANLAHCFTSRQTETIHCARKFLVILVGQTKDLSRTAFARNVMTITWYATTALAVAGQNAQRLNE